MAGELRVGFLGFGFIGKVHAFGYRTMPFYYPGLPPAKLVAAMTSSPETGEKARADFGFERITSDFKEITEAPDIDIVHIATPNVLHRDALLSAIAADKHIYCEKPLVASLDEAREVEEALEWYKGTGQMVLQNRFFPATIRAKQLVDEGFLGRALSFRAAYLHSGSADPSAPLKWKLSKSAAGGGVLFDLGSHILDLVKHLVGDFAEVTCNTSIAFAERPSIDGKGKLPVEAEDHVIVNVRTPEGGLGSVEATKIATGALDELRFEIHGVKGAMRFNSMRPNWLEIYRPQSEQPSSGWQALDTANVFPPPATGFPGPKFSVGWIRSHVACLANFIEAINERKTAEPSLNDGVRLHEIMDSCYRSAETGQTVKL